MSKDNTIDHSRRNLLVATSTIGGIAVVGTAVPFVASLTPSERAKALGAPVEVDISNIEPGTMKTVDWQGKPVWILNRTKEMLASLTRDTDMLADPESKVSSQQPEYAQNLTRSIKPEWLVVVGICTHLGCTPTPRFTEGEASGLGKDWPGGFFCPCHGSTFDLSGRVFKDKPAPTNLVVPPYQYLSDTRVLIGNDKKVDTKEG